MDWPNLVYSDWVETYRTIHLWTQIVGKVRLCHEPWVNHSWGATLYVSSRGLTTSAIPYGEKLLTLEFDFIDHLLSIRTSEGHSATLPLNNDPISNFYNQLTKILEAFEIRSFFEPKPNELSESISFSQDFRPRIYFPEQAHNFWQILIRVNNVLKDFRAQFVGKCSPVHFFWGGFDLAVTRFSGRRAPMHPGHITHLPDRVAREAYSHEVSSCGFWPGNNLYPHAAFYSYAYPEPIGFSTAGVASSSAFYHPTLREFILPYKDVRKSDDPSKELLRFLQSTYEATATLGLWNRDLLEESPFRSLCENEKSRLSPSATKD